MKIEISKITEIVDEGTFDDEYVYDIGVRNGDPYFFGNDILVHNSIYFSPPSGKDLSGNPLTKDSFIALADSMAATVNASFSDFYQKTFNASPNFSHPIRCGREICASTAYFIKKKRYAALYYIDEKNIRYDKDGKPGKLKVMGLDLRRADCPAFVQKKLEDTLFFMMAKRPSESELVEFIRKWRQEFLSADPWQMGIPKRVNNYTHYKKHFDKQTPGITIPGHVRAAINWNNFCEYNDDKSSMKITDGQKVIVCSLKPNALKIDSIAYPIDQQFLPEWFKTLSFDDKDMVEVAVDKKISNIFGILNWDLNRTKTTDQFEDFFTYE